MTSNLNSKQISMLGFFYFQLFICPPDIISQCFSGNLPPEPASGLHHQPAAELTLPPLVSLPVHY